MASRNGKFHISIYAGSDLPILEYIVSARQKQHILQAFNEGEHVHRFHPKQGITVILNLKIVSAILAENLNES